MAEQDPDKIHEESYFAKALGPWSSGQVAIGSCSIFSIRLPNLKRKIK